MDWYICCKFRPWDGHVTGRQMTKVTEWLTKLLNWIICPPPNFGPTKNHTYTPQSTLSRCIICQHSPSQLSVPIALPNRPHTCQFAWTSQGQNDFGKYGAIILRNFKWWMYCYHVPSCDFLSVIDNVTFRSSYLDWGKIVNSPQLIFTVKEILGFGFSEITGASLSQATFTYNDPNQTKEIQ